MRVLVTGGGGFVGAHVGRALEAAGHVLVSDGEVEAWVQLTPEGVRAALDAAWARGARLFVLLSRVGADAHSIRGQAEELVRAAGLSWAVLRSDILWGPGDIFTNEVAHLLRHVPILPVPRGGRDRRPLYAGDMARGIAALVGDQELWGRTWAMVGPEAVSPAELVERVGEAAGYGGRRRLRVPASWLRLGIAVEERVARRPRGSRAVVDRLLVEEGTDAAPRLEVGGLREMTVDAMRGYLGGRRRPEEQLAGGLD